MPADTADDNKDLETDQEQTLGDTAAARQDKQGDKPKASSDDSDHARDPLARAQIEPETDEEPATAAPSPTAKTTPPAAAKTDAATSTPTPKAKTEPVKPKAQEPEAEDDEALASSNLPDDDWQKGILSHKAKSQFLAQRKILNAQRERIKAAEQERTKAEERFQVVEKFVREQGLENEEYVNSVATAGMIKRADPRVIPVLERTLLQIRRAAGIPETPAPAAQPMLDETLSALLKEAEDVGIDTTQVRSRFQAKPATQPATQPAAQQQQMQQPAERADLGMPQHGDQENIAILEALTGLGVDERQAVEHVKGLIDANPNLARVPVGQRLKAVLKAHKAHVESSAQPVRQTTTQPLQGRGRPPLAGGRTTTTNADPLKRALFRPGR